MDIFTAQEVDALKFFPGMNQPTAKKIDLLATAIDAMSAKWDIVTMRQHADAARKTAGAAANRDAVAV